MVNCGSNLNFFSGMVHSRAIKGGIHEMASSHVPLTAYVIASLLQAGASKFVSNIETLPFRLTLHIGAIFTDQKNQDE